MVNETDVKSTKEITVRVDDPEHMNLLGLLMQGLLSTNIAIPKKARLAAVLKGRVLVVAGEMGVTLAFDKGDITCCKGEAGPIKARVAGDMVSLLNVVTEGAVVGPFLSGRIRIGGNLLFLLKLLPLIRAEESDAKKAVETSL